MTLDKYLTLLCLGTLVLRVWYISSRALKFKSGSLSERRPGVSKFELMAGRASFSESGRSFEPQLALLLA